MSSRGRKMVQSASGRIGSFAPCFFSPTAVRRRNPLLWLCKKHQGWQRTLFTEHEQVFKYPEQVFRASEQMFRYLGPGDRYLVPGTWYRLPGTRYQVPGTRYLVPGTRYRVPDTRTSVHMFRTPNTEHEHRTVRTVFIANPDEKRPNKID